MSPGKVPMLVEAKGINQFAKHVKRQTPCVLLACLPPHMVMLAIVLFECNLMFNVLGDFFGGGALAWFVFIHSYVKVKILSFDQYISL